MHIITQRPKAHIATCSCGKKFTGSTYVTKVLLHVEKPSQVLTVSEQS